MKRSDLIVTLAMLTILGYVGFREFQLNKFVAQTKIDIQELQETLASNNRKQSAALDGVINSQEISSKKENIFEEKLKLNLEGFYCDQKNLIYHFSKNKNVKVWDYEEREVTSIDKMDAPYGKGKWALFGRQIQISVTDIKGQKHKMNLIVKSINFSNDNEVETIQEAENVVLTKFACI